MEYINDELRGIYKSMYESVEGTPDDKFEQIKGYCMEDPDRWDLSEDEYGDIYATYERELFNYLKLEFEDFE